MVVGWYMDAKGRRIMDQKSKSPDSEKITINLGLIDLGQIDLLVREGFYSSDRLHSPVNSKSPRRARRGGTTDDCAQDACGGTAGVVTQRLGERPQNAVEAANSRIGIGPYCCRRFA